MSWLKETFLLGLCLCLQGYAGGTLQDGRYTGWIKLEAAGERLALTTDFFQESPENFTEFPNRNAIFRIGLGGYHTHEYYTEIFKDIRYDFDDGNLTLDEPKNDLLITAEVATNGTITGKVFIRSSAVWGTLYLKYLTDEPGDDEDSGPVESSPFVPELEGQYEGVCDKEKSVLQIQTIRGLKTKAAEKAKDTSALGSQYGIVARLAGTVANACGVNLPKGLYCTNFNYPTATYNPYLGKLVLQGAHSSDRCDLRQGEAICRVKIQQGVSQCRLKKTPPPVKAEFFGRRFHLSANAEQMAELPAPNPPKNTELAAALRGVYSGYLHHESNDHYQIVQLSVVPYSYSNNPHNPNQLAVSTTASLFFGDSAAGPFLTQRYEPRSFYLRPGFTLSGPDTDSFIAIQEWKRGFIRGIWYSHVFGRVGTVELASGNLQPPPAGMRLVKDFTGEFEGAPALNSETRRWVQLVFPAQPNAVLGDSLIFSGSAQSQIGVTSPQNIDSGAFDLYTGRFGWIYTHGGEETFTSAYLDENRDLKLYWPPSPKTFGTFLSDFEYLTFRRLNP